ncbi:MAG TPA: methyltransferase domain-containing protein [Thermoleophilaceae bacterium]|jgi:predicted TPR repeat methyltransferase
MSTGAQYQVRLPSQAGAEFDQDQEWCEVEVDGARRRIRFHDYDEIYSIPGLYEHLFYELLECDSPRAVAELLGEQLRGAGRDPAGLHVFEVGAGNGMVARELTELGVDSIVGVDIIEEARMAAERDRPGLYEDYLVLDLTNVPPDVRRELEARRFNCLVTVAALGFGDIPPNAFAAAHNLIDDGGLIVFNIKEDFIADGDGSGFSRLISDAFESGALAVRAQRRYQHRLSVAGQPLHYVAIVAEKRADLPIE